MDKVRKQKQSGFTLIELIIVIVILGILAVTASPKFLDLQGDAVKSTLEGVKGSLEGAGNITYGKALVAGTHKEASTTISSIDLVYGYPAASQAAIQEAIGITLNADGSSGDFDFEVGSGNAYIDIFPNGKAAPSGTGTCYLRYTAATSATQKAVTTITDTGC